MPSNPAVATPPSSTAPDASDMPREHHDVIVIGSGFAGLGMAIRLHESGREDFIVLERADGPGGTWRFNSYPGCACDVPSNLYSFSFALNPNWSRSFSPQQEIEQYLIDCAHTFGVADRIRYRQPVTAATWDAHEGLWLVVTPSATYSCRILVGATGPLSEPKLPDVPGRDTFEGTTLHTGAWDREVDLTGKRVAVVGTGASAIQVVPELAKIVDHLDVYQRTPPWIMPRTDRPISSVEHWAYRHVPGAQRLVRESIYWARESFVIAFTRQLGLLKVVEGLARKHLARQVPNADLRAALTPTYRIGCKRILLSNDYYPALGKSHVDLITHGIARIGANHIETVDGTTRDVDAIVYATGFHVTDLPTAQIITGTDGMKLADVWANGMEAHHGTSVAGFPNLFFLIGPNTGLGHSSMIVMIEAQIHYVLDALDKMDAHGVASVDVRPEVQRASNDALQAQLAGSVWNTGGCASWYLDARGRNTTLWPTFTFTFRHQTRTFVLGDHHVQRQRRHRTVTDAPTRQLKADSPVMA